MTNDFIEYLKDYSSKAAAKERLFLPDSEALTKNAVIEAEKELGCDLPAGYATFLQTLGAGCWADAIIKPPEDLYAFDEAVGKMCGCIALAENVDGCGNSVAFDPQDQQLYFCCHDPFGYAPVASSFEEYVKLIAEHWIKDPNSGTAMFYKSLTPFVDVMPPQPTGHKHWWEFWK